MNATQASRLILAALAIAASPTLPAQNVFDSDADLLRESHLARVRNQRLLQSQINYRKGHAINLQNRYNRCQQNEAAKSPQNQNAMNCAGFQQTAARLNAEAAALEQQQFTTTASSAALSRGGIRVPVRTITTTNVGKPLPSMPSQFSGKPLPNAGFGVTGKPSNPYPTHPRPRPRGK